jgi:hypothetical protein
MKENDVYTVISTFKSGKKKYEHVSFLSTHRTPHFFSSITMTFLIVSHFFLISHCMSVLLPLSEALVNRVEKRQRAIFIMYTYVSCGVSIFFR